MLNRIRRASAGLVLAVVATTGAVAVTAGPASAAPQPAYVNDLIDSFAPTDPNSPVTAFGLCYERQQRYNSEVYGNPNGGGDQYYYCAGRSDGGANLWWRHWV